MDIDYNVPFYSNTSDDTHCFQAALRMVLKYFKPEKEFTWKELEKITAKGEGLWTWQTAGLLWMRENGFDVIDIETFNYEKFSKEGEEYLIKTFGEEVAKVQITHSNINQEQELAKELLKKDIFIDKTPNLEMIKEYLGKKYLVICLINADKLNGKDGYTGHFAVVKGFDDKNLILQDPGLPPQENRKVSYETFENAWASPNQTAKNIMAFLLRN